MDESEYNRISEAIRSSQLSADESKLRSTQQEIQMNQQERGMIAEQLDLGDELDRIDYLLRGYTMEHDDETGQTRWTKPTNKDMIILSDYGVHLIRNTIAWYLNKNTLLSNYDDKTILSKMEDFASDLNDTVFMEYEKVFQYPSLEDCKDILLQRIQQKKDIKVFALELLGKKVDEKQKQEIEDKLLMSIEPLIERELNKIKEQIIKNKLKRFMIIIREVQDAVHSTYLRAWKGQERTTLRQHIQISETKGGYQIQPNSSGPFDWLKRK